MTELERWAQLLQVGLGIDKDLVVDIGAILDLARVAAHEVDRPAAPLTTFLVGYAAGRSIGGSSVGEVERLSARAVALAESWSTLSPPSAGPPEST